MAVSVGMIATEFLPLSDMANSNAPRHWTYTTVDSQSTIAENGYFNDVIHLVEENDLIWAVGDTETTQTFTLIFIDAITDGVVITLTSAIISAF